MDPAGTSTFRPCLPSAARPLLAGAAAFLLSLPLAAEEGYWVIEHATVLAGDPGAPRVVEDGRIVIRRGLIVAAGRDVPLPPDAHLAERIDATGLLAHPALIDAFTEAGVERRALPTLAEDTAPDASEGPIARTREARRTGVRPERSVLELWSPRDELLERFRRHGFGAALVGSGMGFLPGANALVSLRGGPLRNVVITPAHSQRLRFARDPAGGYPNSLMGAIAYMRQTFLDARRHAAFLEEYRHGRRGLPRPPADPALEALGPVLAAAVPVLIDADSRAELYRAAKFRDAFGLRALALGAAEAHRMAGWLRAAGMPLVVTADLGKQPEIRRGEGSLPPRVQEDEARRWRERVEGFRTLQEAGVPFTFGTGAGADPGKLLENVRLAAEEGGLGWQNALRALSLGAAEILGVQDRLGSIEPGKAAHLVLRTPEKGPGGYRLTAPSAVRHLFTDGVRFEVAPPSRSGAARPPSGATEGERGPERPAATPEALAEKPRAEPRKEEPVEEPYPSELDEDRRPRLRTGGNLLIRGATVLTCARAGILPGCDIRITGGRIDALGQGLEPAAGMAVLEAGGLYVLPGIIDCHSHIAVDGGVNESSQSITCEVRIRDALDGDDIALYRALAGGVTVANILHGSANTIGGQNCVIRTRWGVLPGDLPFPGALESVKFALGENPRRSNWASGSKRFPLSRMGVEAVIRRAFAEAARYQRELEDHGRALARGERLPPPRRDLRLEALLEVLAGRRVIHCHSYRADEILMILRAARELGLHLRVLQHALEGYKVAAEIARSAVGASTFSDWWAYKLEAFDAIPHNPALMARAGVVVSVSSDDPDMMRRLPQEAAKSVRSGGLDHDEALALITRNPALELGILDRVATVEVGKDADLAIFDAHPLSIYARCCYTLIQGEVWFERRGEGPERGPLELPRPPRREDLPEPPRSATGIYVLRGARVVPVAGEPIEPGLVVVEGGRISRVGRAGEVEIPRGAAVLDLEGLHVYPGFIDCGTRLGIQEISSVPGSVDSRELGQVEPDLLVATAVNADSELIPVARAGGITAAAVFAGGPLVAGQACLLRLRGRSAEEMVFRERLALHIDLPRVEREAKEEPPLVRTLEEQFGRARRRLEAAQRGGAPSPPPDPELEALRPYLDRELPVVFSADSEAQIRLAVELAGRLGVRGAIRGGRDAWKVAGLLAEKGLAVIAGPVHALPLERFDPYDAPYANPGMLARAGVPVALQTAHAALVCNLRYMAGTAVAHGLGRAEALRAVTLGAAEILGVGDALGSLEPGKLADLIVTDGDPFELTTHILYVFIGGEPVSLENRHSRLYRQSPERGRAAARGVEL